MIDDAAIQKVRTRLAIMSDADSLEASLVLEHVIKQRDEARDMIEDVQSTMSAWFETSRKTEDQIEPILLNCLKGYLRTSQCGGMPSKDAAMVEGVLGDMISMYGGKALLPVLRGIAAENQQSLK